jgi:hypothetical protein
MPLLLCLTDPKKREVLLHLSREKKIEFQERIYNQHIGSFSPEPFGWLAPPSLLGAREPTLSWNQLHSLTRPSPAPRPALPHAARRPPPANRAITIELILFTRTLRGGPVFPGSSTTPSNGVWGSILREKFGYTPSRH